MRLPPMLALLMLACGGVAGCTSGQDNAQLFADPGKYQYHNCDQLAAARKIIAEREEKLRGLIDKAEQGPAGTVVGTIAYRTDYIAAAEELRVIDAARSSKNCPPPPAPAPASAIAREAPPRATAPSSAGATRSPQR